VKVAAPSPPPPVPISLDAPAPPVEPEIAADGTQKKPALPAPQRYVPVQPRQNVFKKKK
jgi:hypothetical protein